MIGGTLQRACSNTARHACRQRARHVVDQAAAGDVRHRFDVGDLLDRAHLGRVGRVRREQRVAERRAVERLRVFFGCDQRARQRVAVRVQSDRRQTEDRVALGDALLVRGSPRCRRRRRSFRPSRNRPGDRVPASRPSRRRAAPCRWRGTPAPRRARPRPPSPVRACRPPGSRERTAASPRRPGCR